MKLIKKNGIIYKAPVEGAGRHYAMDDTELLKYIINNLGMPFDLAVKKMPEFKANIPEEPTVKTQKEVAKSEKAERIQRRKEIITDINPFKHMKLIENSNHNSLIVVWEKDEQLNILGAHTLLNDPGELTAILSHLEPKMLELMKEAVSEAYPSEEGSLNIGSLVSTCIDILDPALKLPRIALENEDIHPAVVEGSEVIALKKIPYQKQNVKFNELNKYLIEFLQRVDNHKHLCAILWGQFTGLAWPYIIYLYGKNGREGKTSFINMLAALTKSFGTITEDNKFILSAIYGKSIIMVPENEKTRLIQSRIIKSITGGNLLSIEAKGKAPFSGKIRGTLIVDANVPLNVSGKDFETERLRYFNVESPKINKAMRLSPEEYVSELKSTPNVFLNYCRQCYEELKTDGGMLREPDNHEEIMNSLADLEQNFEFEKLTDLVCVQNKLAIDISLAINVGELLHMVKTAAGRKTLYTSSYKVFLEQELGIIEHDKKFLGIGIRPTKGTTLSQSNPLDKHRQVD